MMTRLIRLTVFSLTLSLLTSLCYAKEIGKINLPDTHDISQPELSLNGGGIRTKFFLKLYIGGLYLQHHESDPAKIIAADEPMAIKLHIISSMITSEKMIKATREGFENSTGENIEPIRDKIRAFISVFSEKIRENDIFDLVYIPGKGVEVFKNGNPKSLITGLDFKKALFGIWLCDKPAQESLKEALLGL